MSPMAHPLESIINLIKKTGDRCIIIDAAGNPAYVALSFSEYEKLISDRENLATLNEDEMLDKINRDVANWRSSQQAQQLHDWDSVENAIQGAKSQKTNVVSNQENSLNKEENQLNNDQYYFEPIE